VFCYLFGILFCSSCGEDLSSKKKKKKEKKKEKEHRDDNSILPEQPLSYATIITYTHWPMHSEGADCVIGQLVAGLTSAFGFSESKAWRGEQLQKNRTKVELPSRNLSPAQPFTQSWLAHKVCYYLDLIIGRTAPFSSSFSF
jgi:hypothetical protein